MAKPETAAANAAAETKPKAENAKPKGENTWYVLDRTAQPDQITTAGTVIKGERVHEMPLDGVLRQIRFEHGKPTAMPREIAVKFLRHGDGFVRTDAEGRLLPFAPRPKQPHELGAGESFKLAENETVARYDELASGALLQRVLELHGGERFAKTDKPDRAGMIDFIKTHRAAIEKANASKEGDIGADDFVPEPIEDGDDE